MNTDEMLGIDLDDPVQQNADQLVDADEQLLDDLISLRMKLNLSQADVARRLGVDPSAIARIESGDRDPHLSTLRRYALAIGARVEHKVSQFNPRPRVDQWAVAALKSTHRHMSARTSSIGELIEVSTRTGAVRV